MLAFVGAVVGALVLTGVLVPVLRRSQFMDVPNHRSSHSQPVPRGGGLAVVATVIAVAAVTVELDTAVVVLLAATALLAGVGLVDDVRSLPSTVRLVAQLGVAFALGLLLVARGEASLWWLPVLVVGVAGFVNAFNFMDGVNGISGLTALTVGLWWGWAGDAEGHTTISLLGLVLAGSALGFLPWNAPRAKIFLGDVGSYGMGVFIAGLSAFAFAEGLPWLWVLAPLVVYVADTGWVLLKRARAGKSLTEAHREHVYQRLVDGGWPHLASAALCAAATGLVCAVAGAAGTTVTWWAVAAGVAVVAVYLNAARVHHTLRSVS